jgi:hypothetical protein
VSGSGPVVVSGGSAIGTVGSAVGVFSCSVVSGDPAVDTDGCCVVEGIEGSVVGEVSSSVVSGGCPAVVGDGDSVVSGDSEVETV